MHQFSTFKSSIPLYGLTRKNGDGQYQEVSCTTTSEGVSVVRAFVSRLDAELAAQNSDLEAQLLSRFFCPDLLAMQQDGINLHVCLGFAANNRRLSLQNRQLVPLGWFAHIDVRSWGDGYYLDWGDELPLKFGRLYDLLKLANYSSFLDTLNAALPKEMHWHKSEAIGVMPTEDDKTDSWNQVALFDPVECRWRYGSTTGAYQVHVN